MKRVAGIAIPDTALARDAGQTARAALPPELYNHSLRTYLFAGLLARESKTSHDEEALFVASILHDCGLSPDYTSERNRFEIDGANLAREVLARHGVGGPRADVVWDAIALHATSFADWKQTEVRLVREGVDVDFGSYLEMLPRADVVAVLEAAPRAGFIPAFLEAVATVARKKPHATGTSFVADVAYRMVPDFAPHNFVDAVRSKNPFESFGPAGAA